MSEQGTPSSTEHKPDGPWEFDESVTAVFDDMLRRSIPGYDDMREIVYQVGRRFVPKKGGWIVDLGASRGGSVERFLQGIGAGARYHLIEVSLPMVEALRENLAPWTDCGVMQIVHRDLKSYYPPVPAHLTMATLTLQFIPINYRQQIVQNVYDATQDGGAFILVEKVLGSSAIAEKTLVDAYHDLKRANGYPQDAVDAKRESLEGRLVPLSAQWNEETLKQAGFTTVECIWRHYNFVAWLAVK